ncbi:MAG: AMIN domain-containing protein, partial [Thermodesulfobacteriota bacterium]
MKLRNQWVCLLICGMVMMGIPGSAGAQRPEDKFHSAEACYERLKNDPVRVKYRHNWLMCIDRFTDVYQENPSGAWAAAGLFHAAHLYEELYKRSQNPSDRHEAVDLYQRILKRFPRSSYSRKAALALEGLNSRKGEPPKEEVRGKEAEIKKEPDRANSITGIRFWSNPTYTRVVVDVSEEVGYTYKLLEKDPTLNRPRRLYVDLEKTRLEKDITNVVPIHDDLLSEVRAGQHQPDLARVVVDI